MYLWYVMCWLTWWSFMIQGDAGAYSQSGTREPLKSGDTAVRFELSPCHPIERYMYERALQQTLCGSAYSYVNLQQNGCATAHKVELVITLWISGLGCVNFPLGFLHRWMLWLREAMRRIRKSRGTTLWKERLHLAMMPLLRPSRVEHMYAYRIDNRIDTLVELFACCFGIGFSVVCLRNWMANCEASSPVCARVRVWV